MGIRLHPFGADLAPPRVEFAPKFMDEAGFPGGDARRFAPVLREGVYFSPGLPSGSTIYMALKPVVGISQSVSSRRGGYLPVILAARVGEQRANAARVFVNRIPPSAK